MSTNEKNGAVDTKVHDKTASDVESANEIDTSGYPSPGLHGEDKLVRQLKNRHIAMIRCVIIVCRS